MEGLAVLVHDNLGGEFDRWLVVGLATVNALIATGFAYVVSRRSTAWRWPPTWLRVVANWLSAKALFFFCGLTISWAFGWVDFTGDAPWWGKATYLLPLSVLTFAHGIAALYWATGRATTQDTPAVRRIRRRRKGGSNAAAGQS